MEHQTDFPKRVVEHEDMGIVMSDGCRLSARVWMPDDATENPVPVILEHLPYRKRDGTIVRDQFTHPWMAGHGYCCIRTDMRGSGDSNGLMDDEYTQQEWDDACEVIAWATEQPWCNGKVGMMGISWGGFNSLQLAALNPPALKAIITICSTVDRYADDIHYKGSCLLLENFGWAANMLSYSSRPPDAELVGEKWKDVWLKRLENQPWHWSTWMRHQHRDSYWEHGSVCEDYSGFTAAVLSIGGWHDGYRNTISHLVENLSSPVKGIVGPWNHKYPHYAGPQPAIGFLQEAKRWWDRWLKDEETGVEDDPAYRAYLMDSLPPKRWFNERPGRWIAEQHWPSQNTTQRNLHLGANGSLQEKSGVIDASVSSNQDCGKAAGEYFPFAFGDELPDEQSVDNDQSLCFIAEPTDQATDIVGAPRVRFSLASNKPNSLIAVRLCDQFPDGTSALITHGVFNLTHYRSHTDPTALTEDEVIDIEFDLDQIAYRLPAGHQLSLAISNAYWPTVWPSPETNTVTLKNGSVSVPIRETATDDEWAFEKPVGAPPWEAEAIRPSNYSRTTQTDQKTGLVTTHVFGDSGENRDLSHGLISGSWFDEKFFIHPDDPLSARCTAEWEQTGGRENALWRTHCICEMWCDQTTFYSTAKLTAFENEKQVFERVFEDSVKRELV